MCAKGIVCLLPHIPLRLISQRCFVICGAQLLLWPLSIIVEDVQTLVQLSTVYNNRICVCTNVFAYIEMCLLPVYNTPAKSALVHLCWSGWWRLPKFFEVSVARNEGCLNPHRWICFVTLLGGDGFITALHQLDSASSLPWVGWTFSSSSKSRSPVTLTKDCHVKQQIYCTLKWWCGSDKRSLIDLCAKNMWELYR